MIKPSTTTISFDRLQTLCAELRTHSPQWADRLDRVSTEQDLCKLVCDLFNLSHALPSASESLCKATTLSAHITHFVGKNLHRGPTLKMLANFIGYSEKYSSDLFHRVMGESFSGYIKRHRVAQASTLLTMTGQTLAEIAAALGCSDQFAFSHFFKRATGHAPIDIRTRKSAGGTGRFLEPDSPHSMPPQP
jgi:AraC-like DNA-binding protein